LTPHPPPLLLATLWAGRSIGRRFSPIPVSYTDHRRHRYCLDYICGHYAWGGLLQDRPTTAYLDIVEVIVDDIYEVIQRRDEYIGNAQSRKARGWNDVKNHRQLIRELEAANPDL
jgi:hypothetical protein